MRLPIQITFRDLPHSDALEQQVREHAVKLETYFNGLTSCRVVIEALHRHSTHGDRCRVRLELTASPRKHLVASEQGDDAYALVRRCFQTAERQVREHAARLNQTIAAE